MDSRPGLYDSVLVLDYKSLYPSIIRTFLIDSGLLPWRFASSRPCQIWLTISGRLGRRLVEYVNNWWQKHLKTTLSLDCALELEYETHFCRFLMPTIRGTDQGSKKRYAGLIQEGDEQRMVFKGLETVRTDWTPLAQQFQGAGYAHRQAWPPEREAARFSGTRLTVGAGVYDRSAVNPVHPPSGWQWSRGCSRPRNTRTAAR